PSLIQVLSVGFLLSMHRPPTSPLFPYTTLFRSNRCQQIFKIVLTAQRGMNYVFFAVAFFTPRKLQSMRPGSNKSSANITGGRLGDRKSTRLNSSHVKISYAVFCLKKKKR